MSAVTAPPLGARRPVPARAGPGERDPRCSTAGPCPAGCQRRDHGSVRAERGGGDGGPETGTDLSGPDGAGDVHSESPPAGVGAARSLPLGLNPAGWHGAAARACAGERSDRLGRARGLPQGHLSGQRHSRQEAPAGAERQGRRLRGNNRLQRRGLVVEHAGVGVGAGGGVVGGHPAARRRPGRRSGSCGSAGQLCRDRGLVLLASRVVEMKGEGRAY